MKQLMAKMKLIFNVITFHRKFKFYFIISVLLSSFLKRTLLQEWALRKHLLNRFLNPYLFLWTLPTGSILYSSHFHERLCFLKFLNLGKFAFLKQYALFY